MELRDELLAADASRSVDELARRFGNLSGGISALDLRERYLREVESAEAQLGNLFPGREWEGRLFSERFWRIRDLHEGSPRPFPVITDEARAVTGWLKDSKRWLDELAEEEAKADPKAFRLVLDTNAIMQVKPFKDCDWPRELGVSAVRLIVPLIAVMELDNLKNSVSEKKRVRARRCLSEMRAVLKEQGRGPAVVRQGVTLEVQLTPRGHVRHPNNDEEILLNAESLSRRPGGPYALATADQSMQLRAEARGLRVIPLPERFAQPLFQDD